MIILHTNALTSKQKRDAAALDAACKKAEPLTLSVPLEDGLDYLLAYDCDPEKGDARLMGLSFLLMVERPEEGDAVCEFTAFVDPAFRRQHIFSDMLNQAFELADAWEAENSCILDFCFLTDEKTPSAMAVLNTLGAEYWYSEHKMVRALQKSDETYVPQVHIEETEENLYTASLDGTVVGTCALLPCSGETYLYAFQIRSDLRGRGLGNDFLRGMLALLAKSCPQVSLQVSGLNYAARNLYKKTGFRTAESLSYYIYS